MVAVVLRNLRNMLKVTGYFTAASFVFLLPLASAGIGYAQSNAALAREFKTETADVAAGALVGLKKDDSTTVELATHALQKQLVGVVTDTSAIELSEGDNGVKVVTSGLSMALVSDINGALKVGDKVMPSPIKGIGMKATEDGTVIGTAQADLAGSTLETREVTDRQGEQRQVRIGLIPVMVNVAYYSLPAASGSAYVPASLQSIADDIAGRNVSAIRVIAAGLMLVLVIACIAALLYGAIRSSIVAIGRNPLSEVAVRKGMIQVITSSGIILVISSLAIYLVLAL